MKFISLTKKIPQLVVLVGLIVFVGLRTKDSSQGKRNQPLPNSEIEACIRNLLPNTSTIEKEADEVWIIRNSKNVEIGKAIIAQQTTNEIKGYSGPTPAAIIIDQDNKIECVGLLPNSETPRFVDKIREAGYFDKWKGMAARQAADSNLDAVSGATYSSVAINETVKQRMAEYNQSIAIARTFDVKTLVSFIVIALFLLFAILSYFFSRRMAKVRWLLLLLSIVVLGFTYGSFLSIKLIGGWLVQGISLKNQVIFLTLAALSFLLPLLYGRNFYCNYVCPFGASQELLGKICSKKVELPESALRVLLHTRSKVMLLVLAIAVFGSTIDVTDAEPFTVFLFTSASKGVVVMAVLFLLVSIVIPRSWCRFFCPTGALIDFFKRTGKDILPKAVPQKVQLGAIAVAIAFVGLLFGNEIRQSIIPHANRNQEEVMANIFERKSVRHFTEKQVDEEQLQLLLKAGMAAPTAMNRQPWAFVAITSRSTLDSLAATLPYGKMLEKATAAIAVCGDLTIAKPEDKGRWVMDCSAATENILLGAESMGLGAVWVGVYPEEDRIAGVQRILEMPETAIPLCVIAIGYPTGEDKPKDKFKPERIRWQRW